MTIAFPALLINRYLTSYDLQRLTQGDHEEYEIAVHGEIGEVIGRDKALCSVGQNDAPT